MPERNKIGISGEVYGKEYLINKGYVILHCNWRSRRKEIDIIATKDDMLIIVEVKTRSSYLFGFPEESVGIKKQKSIKEVTADFIQMNPKYKFIRFDVLSIRMQGEQVKEIIHYENAFV